MEELVDHLFTLPPEAFVAARDEIVRARRAVGDRAGATAVAGLRRPTVAAWAVNLGVRRAPALVEEMLAMRPLLVRAQRQVLSGVRADLAGLTRQRRQLVEAVVAEVAAALAEHGRDLGPHREEVRLTLEAAVADDDAAVQVRAGRLTRALPGPAGFGTLAGLTAVQGPPEGGVVAPPEEEAARRERAQEARALRDRVEEAAREAQVHAHTVGREAQQLRAEADRLREEADRRGREAEVAAVRARQAEEAGARAHTRAEAGEQRASRARARLETLRRQLAEADELLAPLTED